VPERDPTIQVRVLRPAQQADEARQAAAGLLDAAGLERAGRFRHADDRRAYIAAHGLLRVALADVCDAEARMLRFGRAPDGRPFLVNGPSGLNFSLSHSRSVVAVAAAWDVAVGVDVEDVPGRITDPVGLARSFHPDEAVGVSHAAAGPERDRLVLSLWTLKEAYAKASGTGLPAALGAVSFADGAERPHFPGGAAEAAAWRFRSWQELGFTLALAARDGASPRAVTLRDVTGDPITGNA
jgi:4'-phosphopantetheinyl transferase